MCDKAAVRFNVRERTFGGLYLQDDDFPMLKYMEFSAASELIPLKENWSERWCVLPLSYAAILEDVLEFIVRPDDVFVNTFMKCGTTWMQETVWLLLNNLDFKAAKSINISERCPNLDGSGAVPDRKPYTLDLCKELSSPRVMKSHLPANLLPQEIWIKKARIIFVARNVKDVFISSYHFLTKLSNLHIPMEDYAEEFMNNSLMYMPYVERVVDFWKLRHQPNIFFVTYEEMQADLPKVLQRLCRFLGRSELDNIQMSQMVTHLSFEQMSRNKQSHIEDYIRNISVLEPSEEFRFMRRGIVGSYKDEMSPEIQSKIDSWTADILAKHGIKETDIFPNVNCFVKSSL